MAHLSSGHLEIGLNSSNRLTDGYNFLFAEWCKCALNGNMVLPSAHRVHGINIGHRSTGLKIDRKLRGGNLTRPRFRHSTWDRVARGIR